MVWQSACLASAFLAPALAGWRFYSTAAEDDGGGAPDPVGRLLFTSAFALSALLLELLLAEVAGFLDPALRAAAWAADVRCLLFLLLIALPYTALYRALAARPRATAAGAASGAAAGLAVALAAFWHFGAAWPGVPRTREADAAALSTLARAIARVGAAGAAVVGALSGYGAVALPRANLVAFVRPVTSADVASAEAVLLRTVELAARKRKQAALAARAHAQRSGGMNNSSSVAPPPPPPAALSFFSSLFSSNRSASAAAAAAVELTADAAALDALARELAADALDLRSEAARARAAATLGGKVRNCLGYALSLYCVLRVFGAARELAFPPPADSSPTATAANAADGGGGGTTDPFARALGALLAAAAERAGAPRGALTRADASHYVSVAAVGAIGVGALRAFMRACRKALSSAAAGSSKGASGGSSWRSRSGSPGPSPISASAPLAAALALSEVLGLYALSTTLLTSRRLPLEASAAVDAALGGHLDAGPFHRAFNATFLLAAAATVAVDAVRRALADSPPGVSMR
jgi:hypothetical protein